MNNDTSIYAIDKVNHKIYKSSKTNAGATIFEEFEKSSVKYKNFDVVNPIKDFISESETDENDEIRYKGRRKIFTNMN